jgi:hypothetical protein
MAAGLALRRRRMMANVRAEQPSAELLIPGAAAQTRVVSLAGIRLGSWESARARLVSFAQESLLRAFVAIAENFNSFCNAITKKRRDSRGEVPDINEPLPLKPKWTRRRTYQRIRNEIQALEDKAKTRRFRKPLSTRLFAYHVS